MAQKYPTALIATALGRGVGATAVKAHQLKLSLRMKRGQVQASADPGAAGMDLSV
jgi:hypothetical protein